MIHICIHANKNDRVYATRLSVLDALSQLGQMIGDNYMRTATYIDGYFADQIDVVIRIHAHGMKVEDNDRVEVLFASGSEHFTMAEIAKRFPSNGPTPEQVDAAITFAKEQADVRAHNGAENAHYMAVIAALEWATGREATGKWIPTWTECILGTRK